MIETKRTVTTLDGKQIELKPGAPEVWELRLFCVRIDSSGAALSTHTPVVTAHVTRDALEHCGQLPEIGGKKLDPPPETPEDLLRRLLESIGVVFE